MSIFKCYRCRNIHIWLHLEFRNLDYFSKNIDINSWCFKNIILNKKCRKAEYVQRRVCFVNVQVPCPHSNIYVKLCTSRLCIKMSSFLFVRGCAMPRILYLSCEVPFPVWTPDDISGLISVVPWLSREELSKKNCR